MKAVTKGPEGGCAASQGNDKQGYATTIYDALEPGFKRGEIKCPRVIPISHLEKGGIKESAAYKEEHNRLWLLPGSTKISKLAEKLQRSFHRQFAHNDCKC